MLASRQAVQRCSRCSAPLFARLASSKQHSSIVCSAQPECLCQMSSQFNPAITVWSIPEEPQFPPEMRGAVILTLDDSGKACWTWTLVTAEGSAASQISNSTTIYKINATPSVTGLISACRQCSQPLQAKRQHTADRRLLVGVCQGPSLPLV